MNTRSALAGLLFLWMSATAGICGEKITLASGEWAPYTSKDLPAFGYMSDIVSQAFSLSGIEVEFTFFDSWSRTYVLSQKGEYDGNFPLIQAERREDDFYFSDPVITHTYVFFQRKGDKFDWKTTQDLAQYRIGGTAAYFYGCEFDAAVKEERIALYQSYEDKTSMKNLVQNRIDAFPMDILAGYRLIQKEFSPKIQKSLTHHPKPVGKLNTALAISKQIDTRRAKYLIKAFNKGLKQLKENGQYQKIRHRHRLALMVPIL